MGKEFSSHYEKPISGFSLSRFKKIEVDYYDNLIKHNQMAYAFLSYSLKDVKGIQVLYPALESDVVPFCFSFLVDSRRDELLERLKWRYGVMVWPTLSSDVLKQLKNFPDVELLGRHLLQFSLPSHKVIMPDFKKHLESFVHDVLDFLK